MKKKNIKKIALRKNRFSTFPFYPWEEKKMKTLKWGNTHLDKGKKWKKKKKKGGKKKNSFWGKSYIVWTFLTIDFSLFCFTPSKKKNEKRWSEEYTIP
jgi:hypothetical protein